MRFHSAWAARPAPRFGGAGKPDFVLPTMAMLYFAGLILGALGARPAHGGTSFLFLFAEKLVQLRLTGFLPVTGSVYLASLLMLLIAMLLGSSPFGAPVLSVLPLIAGVGTGSVSSFLAGQMGVQGLAAYLLIFFFPDAFSSLLLLVYCAAAFRMSAAMFSLHVAGRTGTVVRLEFSFRLFVLTSLLTFLVSLFSGILSVLFSGRFPALYALA